ncbi:oxygenase MpaB family protein [Actinoallomurus sp. NPDC050550]|uniref:oxygenase MpaB family protein n=1 Tax=Actinoallomurus sp. NPDC050550 TaxID=3154937 RepID=UPI0033EFA91A
MARYTRLRQIQALDPERDYQDIFRISAEYEFPWDLQRSLELALFRTFAVPSIGELLDHTGEFARKGQKRYDDTVALLYEMTQDGGLDAERGRAALRRMNRIHGRYSISNDDFLYVLATFVVVPVRWISEYGWRPYSRHEVRAATNTFRHIGRLMGLKEIPETYREFADLLDRFEQKNYAFSDANHQVAEATIAIFEGWFPRFLRPLARRGLLSVTDAPLRQALGLPRAPRVLEIAAHRTLKLRALAVRLMPPRPSSRPKKPYTRSYPGGYTLEDIGPAWVNDLGRRTA